MARSERSHHLRRLTPIVGLALFAAACSSPAATPGSSETGASAPPAATDAQSASPGAGVELPPAEQASLRICHQPHISTLSTYLAASEGIFEKYGLDVELVPFEGDGPMGQALAAGQVDGCIMGAGPAFSAATAGESLKMVVVVSDYTVDFLVTPDDIQSGDDLRGQQVAISTYGGESHTIVLFALQSLGLTAEDVTIVQIGGQGDRYAALQAGAVQAAPIEGIPDEELESFGLHKLVNLREVGERYAKNGLVFPASFIEENPNTVLRAVAAHLDALNVWLNDPELGIQVYMEAMEVDEDEARINVEPALDINPTGEMTADMFEVQKAALTAANPDIESVDTADVFDASFLEQLRELGFYEELGIE